MLSRTTRREVIPRVVAIKQTVKPNNAPLLETATTHLKLEPASEAQLNELTIYLESAVAYVERVSRRALFNQTWTVTLDTLPSGNYLQLYQGPLQSVATFTTYDTANNADATFVGYFLDTADDRLCLTDGQSWPVDLRARAAAAIAYVVGYGTKVAQLPATLVQAVLLLVAHWHANRDLTCAVNKEMAKGVSALVGVSRRLHL
jgi:uncharacterized phiE125 gp8 family phage protein